MENNIILDLMLQNCLCFLNNSFELFEFLISIRGLNKNYKFEIDRLLKMCMEHKIIFRRNNNFKDIHLNIESYYFKYLLCKNNKINFILNLNDKINFYNSDTLNCSVCNEIINSSFYTFNTYEYLEYYESINQDSEFDYLKLYFLYFRLIVCFNCGMSITSINYIPVSPYKQIRANYTYINENYKKYFFFNNVIGKNKIYKNYIDKTHICSSSCDLNSGGHDRYCIHTTINRSNCDCYKCNQKECEVCGCSSEFDVYGDRICFCDSCFKHGCI